MTTELEERLARYVAGDRYALDGFDEPDEIQVSSPVLNAGEQLVLRQHQRQRPTLDPATQKLWDDWLDTRCMAIVKATFKPLIKVIREVIVEEHINPLAEHIGTTIGQIENRIDKDLAAASKDMKAVTKEMMTAFRDNLRAEQIEWVRVKDRQFVSEIAEMRDKLISRQSDDMNTMRDDVVAVLRHELAEEIIKMHEESRQQMRRELRTEMSVKMKMFRSFFKRNR